MAVTIAAEADRINRALDAPTLRLLDRKSAAIALPVFECTFNATSDPIAVTQFHIQLSHLLSEMKLEGYDVPDRSAKALAQQWVRERWLYREPGED